MRDVELFCTFIRAWLAVCVCVLQSSAFCLLDSMKSIVYVTFGFLSPDSCVWLDKRRKPTTRWWTLAYRTRVHVFCRKLTFLSSGTTTTSLNFARLTNKNIEITLTEMSFRSRITFCFHFNLVSAVFEPISNLISVDVKPVIDFIF